MKKQKWNHLIFWLGAISSGAALAIPNNSELKIGISQEFENLNPLIMTMVATSYMHRMVGRSLVNMDSEARWVPQLAKEIPSIEKGTARIIDVKGQKKIVAYWNILDTAKWGDGKPVICDDFALSRKVAGSPSVSIAEKDIYTQIEKIESDPKNPKKCTFTYEKARWDFYQLGNFYPLPKHLEESIFNKFGSKKEGYEKNSLYVKNPTTMGLYNGPYVISEVKLGDHVSFAPNPYFYGEPAKIKKIIVKLIPNTGTMEANLRSGTIDMISTSGVALDQALAFDKKVKAENLPFEVTFTPSVTYEHIDTNLDNPILKDIRVRRALMYGINRDELVKALFEDKQQPALHFISPKDPWYTADSKYVQSYRYSKKEANKLLEEAGWVMGPESYRLKTGKKLSLTLMTTAGNKTRELVQVYLQEQWKQIGIEVIIKNIPARVFFSEIVKKRKFEALAMYAWTSSPENSPRSNLSSKAIPSEKNGWSGQNYMNWSNPTVDHAIDSLDLEFNPKKRLELVYSIIKAYTDDIPVLPLYYRSDISMIPKNLKNYKVPGHQYAETNEIEKWTLE